ncbi:enoyl-CoA hydratase/isomerase family protein [Actinacidiphila rubida]|uniref:Methylglutaconyl-CoA hydratase n=1 Tax=Actinacidiphila rubida TaxID=310780 RepID=A0A1H8MV65_9ACTN|nr:enoyl-CoA hydratase/isomerase family protein [Actinacidiphila rubida]SEO21154.1 methylglutaconyl-CoA hydratase [Actinacidiphila rubida]
MIPNTPSSPYQLLRVHQDDKVLRVELHSPDTGNALNDAMLDELLDVLGSAAVSDCRALVLSGAGADFCAGADRSELRDGLVHDPSGSSTMASLDKGRRVCEALETLPVPTIARLHGRVIGAGLVLAVNCDLRIAADTAEFRMPELYVRLVPAWGGGLARLIELGGESRILELMLTGTKFTAAYARQLDLVQRVEAAADVDRAISDLWLRRLLHCPPEAVHLTKRLFAQHRRSGRGASTALLDAAILTGQIRTTLG